MKWSHYWANCANTALICTNLWMVGFFISMKWPCILSGFCFLGLFLLACHRTTVCREREMAVDKS